ncbi:NAD(P)-binding protein, partial [Gymnopus androsaceus JB14]
THILPFHPPNPPSPKPVKTILITGGGGGIGFEIARSFTKACASRIIIVGRRAGVLDEALVKLRKEFQGNTTEFIAHQADIAPTPQSPHSGSFSTLKTSSSTSYFHLINVSTAAVHMHPSPTKIRTATSKAAFMALLGRIADERSVDDIQIVSFHPGALYTEGVAKALDYEPFHWDEFALPADFSVWAASSEASWLHGRFVWAHWDVDELKADREFLKLLEEEKGYLKVGIQGLNAVTLEAMLSKS